MRCVFCTSRARHRALGVRRRERPARAGLPASAASACASRSGAWRSGERKRARTSPCGPTACTAASPLPSGDTWPVIVWVKGEHGVEAVCNACRIRYGRETQFVTLPHADWDDSDARESGASPP